MKHNPIAYKNTITTTEDKIIDLLIEEQSLTLEEICEKIDIPKPRTLLLLHMLEKARVIKKRKIQGTTYYELNFPRYTKNGKTVLRVNLGTAVFLMIRNNKIGKAIRKGNWEVV